MLPTLVAPGRRGPSTSLRVLGVATLLVSVLLVPSVLEAQSSSRHRAPDRSSERSLGTYSETRRSNPIREGMPSTPGGFTFCRLQYTVARSLRSGMGWSTDYPGADFNLTTRLSELTPTWLSHWENGDPGIAVVRPTDPNLFRCPFLFASDIGSATFSDEEVQALREFLLKGGLLWVDDFWQDRPWNFWVEEISRILPEFPIVDMPMDHPLLSIVYNVTEIPQIPHIGFWRRSGGQTSEFGAESAQVNFRAIFDDEDRLLVLMTHNTDIADGWEREMDDNEYFRLFSPDAYALGVNVLVWTMTH